MTAEQKFDSNLAFVGSVVLMYKKEIVQMMKEFAREKCIEQRENCIAEYFEEQECYYEILNAKEPEL